MVEEAEVLWRPPADARETTRMGQYMTWLAENRGLVFDSYAQLWEWSVTDLRGFWASIWHFFEVQAQTPYQGVLASPTMPGAVWFDDLTHQVPLGRLFSDLQPRGEPGVNPIFQAMLVLVSLLECGQRGWSLHQIEPEEGNAVGNAKFDLVLEQATLDRLLG